MTNEETLITDYESSNTYPMPNNNDWQYLRGFYDAVNMMMNINRGNNNK